MQKKFMGKISMAAAAAIVSASLLFPQTALAENASLGITTSNVHLRSKASSGSASQLILNKGSLLTVKGHEGSWLKVEVNGKTGYVSTDYVSELEINRTLEKGASGDDVKYLQRTLKELGYYTGEIDGKMGDATVNAVKAFQKADSLTADGKVGTQTWAKLQAATGTTKSENASEVKSTLRKGDSGDAVRDMQRKLKSCGFLTGSVDGDFGAGTEKAVIAFQKAYGLTADGVAGTVTLTRLDQEMNDPTKLTAGDTGSQVKQLQTQLKALGFYSLTVDGEYGAGTVKAVKAFQVKYSLTADGIAGPKTLAKINAVSSSKSSETKTTTTKTTYTPPAANGVELVQWSDIKKLLTYHQVITVYDVKSGKSYQVREFSAGNHADVEPLTAEDTATIKEINGGTFTWTPRPVWVTFNGHTYAASIHSNPHDVSTISDNNFNGHICLHFKGSSTHNGNTSYTQSHQNAVQAAWDAAQTAK